MSNETDRMTFATTIDKTKLFAFGMVILALGCQQQPPLAQDLAVLRTESSQLREQIQRLELNNRAQMPGAWQLVVAQNGQLYLLDTRFGHVFQREGTGEQSVWTAIRKGGDSEQKKMLREMINLLQPPTSPSTDAKPK